MLELLERYGPVVFMTAMIFFSILSYLRALEKWYRTNRATTPPRQFIWATRPKPKQKRKRTLNAPEKRYYETLKAIADREQRPHILHEGETPSDIAQMRDLAHQQYLRECAERQARERAYPMAIIQMPSEVDDFYDRRNDYMASLRGENQFLKGGPL